MLLLILVPILIVLIGVVYQIAGARRDERRYPPPGRLIAIDGTQFHIRTSGEGKPAVIFESGVAASCVNWTALQNAVASFTTTASYDRAGFGWSRPTPQPQTPVEMVDTLRALLGAAGIAPPFVLVGHSFGALLARLYADRWPDDVFGLVLIDPALLLEWNHPDAIRRRMLSRGIALSRRGGWLARIGFVRLSLSLLSGGSRALPKLFSKLSSGRGHSVTERLVGEVRKMPPEMWPAIQSHWCRPHTFESMARHLRTLPEVAALINQANPRSSMPVTVISAGKLTPEQLAEHEAIARSSDRGRHFIASRSGHWIHLDEPEIVIDSIREMVSNYS